MVPQLTTPHGMPVSQAAVMGAQPTPYAMVPLPGVSSLLTDDGRSQCTNFGELQNFPNCFVSV